MRLQINAALLLAALVAAPSAAQEAGVALDDVTNEKVRVTYSDVTSGRQDDSAKKDESHVIELDFSHGDMKVSLRIRDGKVEAVTSEGSALESAGPDGKTLLWKANEGDACLRMKESTVAVERKPKSRLGVFVDEVPESLAHQLGVAADASFMINHVNDGGAAERAGLERFDVVVGLAGAEGASRGRLREILCEKEPGENLDVTVLRKGQRLSLDVTLEPRPDEIPAATLPTGSYLTWPTTPNAAPTQWLGTYNRTAPVGAENVTPDVLGHVYSAYTNVAPPTTGLPVAGNVDLDERLNRLEEQMNRLEELLEKLTR